MSPLKTTQQSPVTSSTLDAQVGTSSGEKGVQTKADTSHSESQSAPLLKNTSGMQLDLRRQLKKAKVERDHMKFLLEDFNDNFFGKASTDNVGGLGGECFLNESKNNTQDEVSAVSLPLPCSEKRPITQSEEEQHVEPTNTNCTSEMKLQVYGFSEHFIQWAAKDEQIAAAVIANAKVIQRNSIASPKMIEDLFFWSIGKNDLHFERALVSLDRIAKLVNNLLWRGEYRFTADQILSVVAKTHFKRLCHLEWFSKQYYLQGFSTDSVLRIAECIDVNSSMAVPLTILGRWASEISIKPPATDLFSHFFEHADVKSLGLLLTPDNIKKVISQGGASIKNTNDVYANLSVPGGYKKINNILNKASGNIID